jgi:hypothetical protein
MSYYQLPIWLLGEMLMNWEVNKLMLILYNNNLFIDFRIIF